MRRPQRLARIGETHATCQTQRKKAGGGGNPDAFWVSTSRSEQVVVTASNQGSGDLHVFDGTSLIQLWRLHDSTVGQAILTELVKGSHSPCLDRGLSFNGPATLSLAFRVSLPATAFRSIADLLTTLCSATLRLARKRFADMCR